MIKEHYIKEDEHILCQSWKRLSKSSLPPFLSF